MYYKRTSYYGYTVKECTISVQVIMGLILVQEMLLLMEICLLYCYQSNVQVITVWYLYKRCYY